MGFINLNLSNVNYLNVEMQQLVATSTSREEFKFNLADINSVLIDNNKMTLSVYTLNALSQNKIVAYFCDDKHLPSTILIPFNGHFNIVRVHALQIECTVPLKKQLWQAVIKQKITNQAECLKMLNINGWDYIAKMSNEVVSGDTGNVEAKAAAGYFKLLFGTGFSRNHENFYNSALNYCYALVRGQIARAIAVYGLQPFLGIHHHSELNNFNLADDLIEPYRPIVDLFVKTLFDQPAEELLPQHKRQLFQILNLNILSKNEFHSFPNSVDRLVSSLVSSMKDKKVDLFLPKLTKIKDHKYE